METKTHRKEATAMFKMPPFSHTYPTTSIASLREGSTIISFEMFQPPSAAMMPMFHRPSLSKECRSTLVTDNTT